MVSGKRGRDEGQGVPVTETNAPLVGSPPTSTLSPDPPNLRSPAQTHVSPSPFSLSLSRWTLTCLWTISLRRTRSRRTRGRLGRALTLAREGAPETVPLELRLPTRYVFTGISSAGSGARGDGCGYRVGGRNGGTLDGRGTDEVEVERARLRPRWDAGRVHGRWRSISTASDRASVYDHIQRPTLCWLTPLERRGLSAGDRSASSTLSAFLPLQPDYLARFGHRQRSDTDILYAYPFVASSSCLDW